MVATTAHAATFTVNRVDDPSPNGCDSQPPPMGDGCSLREAVRAANALAGADIVVLPPGAYTLTRSGVGEDAAATGDLDVTDELTVQASFVNATIDVSNGDRAFHLLDGQGLTLIELTINADSINGEGAGVLSEGADLTLNRVHISGGQAGTGAAVQTLGRVEIRDSLFEANVGLFESGAVRALAGAQVYDSTFLGNSSPECGALDVSMDLLVVNSRFVNNSAEAFGGAICAGGSATIRGSTFDNNSCTENGCGGGAIRAIEVTIEDSYFTSNNATQGAAVLVRTGFANIRNSTFDDDEAAQSGSVLYLRNGADAMLEHLSMATNGFALGAELASSQFRVRNTILSGGCIDPIGTIDSLGGNIESPFDTCGFDQPSDQVAVQDLDWSPAADNGGPSATFALAPTSVALGSAIEPCALTDQRGAPRPLRNDGCDTGAFELLPDDGILVTRFDDPTLFCPTPLDCSLRGAVQAASANPSDHNTIVVPRGEYIISRLGQGEDGGLSGDFDVTGPVTIVGAGMGETVIDGNNIDRIFHAPGPENAMLALRKLTLLSGLSNASGGAIAGSFISLEQVALIGNDAGTGGGAVSATGPLTIVDSFFSNNELKGGDGGAVLGGASVSIQGSTFNQNSTLGEGGAVRAEGPLSIFNSTFVSNFGGIGGAVYAAAAVDFRHVSTDDNDSDAGENDVHAVNAAEARFLNSIFTGGCSTDLGTFVSRGGNVETTSDTCDLDEPTDQTSVDYALMFSGGLGDYGGLTPTIRLASGSPAIDAAVVVPVRRGDFTIGCSPFDQTGFPRPYGPSCDSGSYEFRDDLFSDRFEGSDPDR